MEMFRRFLMSTYLSKKVVMLRFEHPNKTIGYILLLTAFSLLPALLFMIPTIVSGYQNAIQYITTPSTTVYLEDYTLYEEGKRNISSSSFTLDSTTTTEEVSITPPLYGIGLVKDGVFLAIKGQAQVYSYELLGWDSLSKVDLLHHLKDIKNTLFVFIPLSVFLLFCLTAGLKFIQITLFAVIGLYASRFTKKTVTFKHAWVLSAYSITPMTVLFMIIDLFSYSAPYSTSLYLAGVLFTYVFILSRLPIKKEKGTSLNA
ncbi:DUF1189 domain-containing protein [Priestia flexa]|uniref:DUF1189 domain-containing protein n=1 Tax=Priestia flexa TaxID=86664 RepID=UPI002890901A|nr:DUF1189 domain-containing protein [Priestia flexa]MDT2045451.1 DUF1189 domain-containing protein [Priestia flexa]